MSHFNPPWEEERTVTTWTSGETTFVPLRELSEETLITNPADQLHAEIFGAQNKLFEETTFSRLPRKRLWPWALLAVSLLINLAVFAPWRKAPEVTAPEKIPAHPIAKSEVAAKPEVAQAPKKTAVQKAAHAPIPQTPAVPAPAPGLLSLDADPWALVYINGKRLNQRTPVKNLKLAPGRYTIEFRSPKTRRIASRTVTMRAGEHLNIRAQLR